MQIIEDKALLLRTRNPSKFDIIPRSKHVRDVGDGVHEVAVFWGLDEARVLKNLGCGMCRLPYFASMTGPVSTRRLITSGIQLRS